MCAIRDLERLGVQDPYTGCQGGRRQILEVPLGIVDGECGIKLHVPGTRTPDKDTRDKWTKTDSDSERRCKYTMLCPLVKTVCTSYNMLTLYKTCAHVGTTGGGVLIFRNINAEGTLALQEVRTTTVHRTSPRR